MSHAELPGQVARLEWVESSLDAGDEDALRERMHQLAQENHPGAMVTSICRKKYQELGRDLIEIDAAVRVEFPDDKPPLAYIAEKKRSLTSAAFIDVLKKWRIIRCGDHDACMC